MSYPPQQPPQQPGPWPPQYRPPIPPPPRRNRKPLLLALAAVAVATLVYGAITETAGSSGPAEADPTPSPAAPAYDVLNLDTKGPTGKADLLMPTARPADGEAAIRDYADRIDTADLEAYSVDVIRTEDAATVVCRGEWRADDRAAELYGGKPGLAVACPDPNPLP